MRYSAKERMRKYREKIRADPERHALYKHREKERYENKKARGIIRLKTDMGERELRICRREWRKRQKKVRLAESMCVYHQKDLHSLPSVAQKALKGGEETTRRHTGILFFYLVTSLSYNLLNSLWKNYG